MTELRSSPEPLLADLRWLRALAGELVRDPHTADDAVQETLVVSLGRGPWERGRRRAFLSGVLRNVLRNARRASARRERRERLHGGGATSDTDPDALEELAWHRRLVEQVEALREPYRRTVVMRYLRGLSAREIAQREGVATKSVHTRLERALAELRVRLDRECGGDRERWLCALLPFARAARDSSFAGLAGLLFPMNAKLLLLGAGAIALGLWSFLPRGERAQPVDRDPLAGPAEGVLAAPGFSTEGRTKAPQALEGERAIAANSTGEEAPPAPSLLPVRGSVLDLEGRPVPGLVVRFERERDGAFGPAGPSARSDAGGSFELALPASPGRLTVASPQFACIVRAYLDGTPPAQDPVLVVAPSRTLAGRVVDVEGHAIAGARVELTRDGAWVQLLELERREEKLHLLLPIAETSSDADGSFRFESVGVVPGAYLAGQRDGYEEGRCELGPDGGASAGELTLVLAARSIAGKAVHGVVLDDFGAPVRDALVSLGHDSVRSGGAGEFVLPLDGWVQEGVLRAVKPGHLPAARAFAWEEGAEGTAADTPLALQLGPAPLTIRGRVVDEEGEPVAGARVWTPDLTYFGRTLFENGEGTSLGESTVEAVLLGLGGVAMERTVGATSDARGRFELGGLLEREYVLYALDPRSLAAARPRAIAAGEEQAELELEPGERTRVAGRVTSRGGAPLAGVRVSLARTIDPGGLAHRGQDSWRASVMRPPGATLRIEDQHGTTTDEEGRFTLEPIELEGTRLWLQGSSILMAATFALDDGRDVEALELVVDACCRFYVDASDDPDGIDEVGLVDAQGQVLPLFVEVEQSLISIARLAIAEGRSGVAQVREGVGTLALYRAGRELRRVEVRFEPGAVQRVRP